MMIGQTEVEDLIEGAMQEGALFAVALGPTGYLVVPATK